jgi:hypothetical protein
MEKLESVLRQYREAHGGESPAFLAINNDPGYQRANDGTIGWFEGVPVYASMFIQPGAVIAEPYPDFVFTVDGSAWFFRDDGYVCGSFDSLAEAYIESFYLIDAPEEIEP